MQQNANGTGKTMTLRARLTVAVISVLTVTCLAITLYMTFSAQQYFTRIAVAVPMQKVILFKPEQLSETVTPLPTEPTNDLTENLTSELTLQEIPATLISAANALPVVFDSRRNFLLQSIVVMLAAIAGGAGITYLLTGRALRPLQELSRATKNIGGKNLRERVSSRSALDEVGELSRSFNIMMDRLEQSFTAEKRFSGNAAHELKTPLATMKTSLQVLKMDIAPTREEYTQFVETVEHCVDRMIRTVESLLELSSESCEMPDKVDLRALLETILEEISFHLDKQGITANISGDALKVTASEPLLHRAFSNVVENAVKYNRPGGSIKVRIAQIHGMAEVTVQNSGNCISSEDCIHVFEAFYRADKSHSQQIPGFGLGLAIVKLILEKHGGNTTINSSDDCTTVVLRLPLEQ